MKSSCPWERTDTIHLEEEENVLSLVCFNVSRVFGAARCTWTCTRVVHKQLGDDTTDTSPSRQYLTSPPSSLRKLCFLLLISPFL